MCSWVGPHAPSCGRQLWGLPSRMEYLSPQRYCSCKSTVLPPHPRGLSCRAPLLGKRPPPGLCAGTPVISCSMAPGNVCHGPGCSLTGLGQVALDYRSCHWPGGPAGSPQCIRPWGCRLWCPVPLLPSVHVMAHMAPVHRCARCVRCACAVGGYVPLPPPLIFLFVFFVLLCRASSFFFLNGKGGAHTLQAQARATGAAVQKFCVLWRVSSVLWWRPRPRGAAPAS